MLKSPLQPMCINQVNEEFSFFPKWKHQANRRNALECGNQCFAFYVHLVFAVCCMFASLPPGRLQVATIIVEALQRMGN